MKQIPSQPDSTPFGVPTPAGRAIAVLDKSFLDAVGAAQLQYHAQHGVTFVVPEALLYELRRKQDKRRTADLMKLHLVERSVIILPGIGEMFRAKTREHRPAQSVLRAKRVEFLVTRASSGKIFPLTDRERRSMNERTKELQSGLSKLIDVWRSFHAKIESLKDASPKEIPERLGALCREIRDDKESMRSFYGNHRTRIYPAPELIDERWTLFRWIQVYLLAGLDFLERHGLTSEPNPEDLLHERIDLDYTIPALLVGGLACCEKRMIERFKFLRPDGFVLRHLSN